MSDQKCFITTTDKGARIWWTQTPEDARRLHLEASPGDVILSTETGGEWWVWIEKESGDLIAIGPYDDEDVCNAAMQDSLLVDGLCQEDCVDCYSSKDWTPPERQALEPEYDVEVIIIDPNDPNHFG